ncbi:MAG: sigma-70 family RNA polymerase sigma factor [Nitrospinae bacterium]|nr:sigma-70 family RNA polymerase sigma factor [Nitrospinota bacterium]
MSFATRLKLFKNALAENSEVNIFERYIFPNARSIYESAVRLSGNKDDAEDLMQETFFYAIKNFPQLKDRAKCKYWLFAILRNLFLKEIEKNKRRIDFEFDLFSNSLQDIRHIENDYVKAEVEKNVRELLDSLDDRLKKPIVLFYFERLSYKEIADKMDLPIGTVMSRIARGKVYLKKELIRSESFRADIEQWLNKNHAPKNSPSK